jgi:biotin carboxyl carrier protein
MDKFEISVGERSYSVTLLEKSGSVVTFSIGGRPYTVAVEPVFDTPAVGSAATTVAPPPPIAIPRATRNVASPGSVVTPIPGILVSVQVAVGTAVTQGQTVAVVEAMKMENNISAPIAGTVKKICVHPGQELEGGQEILVIAG